MLSSRGKEAGGVVPASDMNWDTLLRPKTFDDYVGQATVKRGLRVMIDAAKARHEAIDHLLFYGQAGLGKTTLAYLVSKELGSGMKVTSGPAIEKAGDLAAILTNLEPRDVLFIDEIHRLNKAIEEVLYPAMESRSLNIMIGKGAAARTLTLDLPPFTLIAATTRVDLLSSPLRSRFGATFRLDYYGNDEMRSIIRRSGEILGLVTDEGAINLLAEASRYTPRVANRLLKRSRDYLEVSDIPLLDASSALEVLAMLDIDERGLEYHDRRLISIIAEQFSGGPVGINTLGAALGEERGTIEEVYEPYLMKIGFLKRTPTGRVVTETARKHIDAARKNAWRS